MLGLTRGRSPQVEEFRKKDAERGVKVAQVLQGFISRKVVKQTVMTVVYGVTRYGGRLQIEKRLKEIDEFPEVAFLCVPLPGSCHFLLCLWLSLCLTHRSASGLCQEYLWEASHYLVKQVFNSIKEMFSATRDIQVRSLLPLTSTCFSSLVHSHIDKGVLHGERLFSWPREDPPAPAQRCGTVPNSPVSAGLSQSVTGVRVACAGRGWGLPAPH